MFVGWSDWSASSVFMTCHRFSTENETLAVPCINDDELYLWMQAHGLASEDSFIKKLRALGVKTSLDLTYIEESDLTDVVSLFLYSLHCS